jgi:hypothetical protein
MAALAVEHYEFPLVSGVTRKDEFGFGQFGTASCGGGAPRNGNGAKVYGALPSYLRK